MIWIILLHIFIGNGGNADSNYRSVPIIVKTFVNKIVELPCQVDNLGEPTRVRWWKEGILLTDTANQEVIPPNGIEMNKWNLKILNVQMDDVGEYVCKASRAASWGDVTQVYAIEVLYPPTVHTIPESGELEVNLGDTVEMACKAKGQPPPTFTWSAKGIGLDLIDNRGGLLFHADSLDRAGRYTCKASNGIGDPAFGNIDLKIRYKPKVTVTKSWIHAAPDMRVHLECNVKAWPEAKVDWYFGRKKIEHSSHSRMIHIQNQDINEYSLIIKRVLESDYGNYICNASNSLGFHWRQIILSGAPKPVILKSESKAISSTTYNFIWEVDSYVPILNCVFKFREIKDGVRGDWHTLYVPNTVDTSGPLYTESFNLTGLNDAVKYEATISCQNRYGLSEPTSIIHFSTSRKHSDKQSYYDDLSSSNEDEQDKSEMQFATISESPTENEISGSSVQQISSFMFYFIFVIKLIIK